MVEVTIQITSFKENWFREFRLKFSNYSQLFSEHFLLTQIELFWLKL